MRYAKNRYLASLGTMRESRMTRGSRRNESAVKEDIHRLVHLRFRTRRRMRCAVPTDRDL